MTEERVRKVARELWDGLREDYPRCKTAELTNLSLEQAGLLSKEFDNIANNSKSDINHHCEVRQVSRCMMYRRAISDCSYKLILSMD